MSAAFLLGLTQPSERPESDETVSSADGRSILAFSRSLPPPPADLIRLYEKKDHFLTLGRDALHVSHSYFRSSAALKAWVVEGVSMPYLPINRKMGGEVIRSCLLRERRRVEVYSLVGGKWVLCRKGSPGNIGSFEEECLVNGELPADASTGEE